MSDLIRTMYTTNYGRVFKGCTSSYWDVEFSLREVQAFEDKGLDDITVSITSFNLTKKTKKHHEVLTAREFLNNPSKVYEV